MNETIFNLLLGHIAMLAFSLLVSLSFVLGVIVADAINPIAITGARLLLAALILLIFMSLTNSLLTSRNWHLFKNPKNYAFLSILISVYFITMFEGLKTSSAISMSAVFTLTPLLTGIFSHLLAYQLLTRKVFFAVVVGAIGSIWVIFQGSLENVLEMNIGTGELIFFVGCIAHSLYAVYIPILNRGESSLVQTFGVLIISSIFVCILGIKPISETDWLNLPMIAIFTILYLAIFATAITFFLIQFSAQRIKGVKVMSYTYAVPFWVSLASGLILNTWPSIQTLCGGVLIGMALYLLLQDDMKSN